ncbi:MAG: helix-turn-helix domain-containing protein [Melioribacteraceae bacterium]|nr:helix-turn-helix domain-containing protein [Melioribacteraceae bacterium]
MKAKFENVTYPVDSAFNIIPFSTPYLKSPWHFHTAYEIVYISEGFGKLFIGNNVNDFKKDDLVFFGPNLPHAWLNDNSGEHKTSGVLIQFKKDFISDDWVNFNEFKYIKNAIEKSKKGIKITGQSKDLVLSGIEKILNAKGIEKITLLIQILDIIGSTKKLETITVIDYYSAIKSSSKEKMEIIFNYILNNYLKPICINEAATLVSMNETAFCRYFKKNTSKTFIYVVNEMRIGYACNLLQEKKLTISEICYKSGFNNISNFNKHFKSITSKTPSEYQNNYFRN